MDEDDQYLIGLEKNDKVLSHAEAAVSYFIKLEVPIVDFLEIVAPYAKERVASVGDVAIDFDTAVNAVTRPVCATLADKVNNFLALRKRAEKRAFEATVAVEYIAHLGIGLLAYGTVASEGSVSDFFVRWRSLFEKK